MSASIVHDTSWTPAARGRKLPYICHRDGLLLVLPGRKLVPMQKCRNKIKGSDGWGCSGGLHSRLFPFLSLSSLHGCQLQCK
eukprot:903375-Amphidinium_carterae.2